LEAHNNGDLVSAYSRPMAASYARRMILEAWHCLDKMQVRYGWNAVLVVRKIPDHPASTAHRMAFSCLLLAAVNCETPKLPAALSLSQHGNRRLSKKGGSESLFRQANRECTDQVRPDTSVALVPAR